jgi:hypothetical protein
VTSVTSTFGPSRYGYVVRLSGIPIPRSPRRSKDNRKTLRVLHHSEGLLLWGAINKNSSADARWSFLTLERNSRARKERAPTIAQALGATIRSDAPAATAESGRVTLDDASL